MAEHDEVRPDGEREGDERLGRGADAERAMAEPRGRARRRAVGEIRHRMAVADHAVGDLELDRVLKRALGPIAEIRGVENAHGGGQVDGAARLGGASMARKASSRATHSGSSLSGTSVNFSIARANAASLR